MGRSGRGRRNEDSVITDNVHLVLSCNDFVYLNQHLYLPPDKPSTLSTPILPLCVEINLQRSNLLRLFQMIVLKGSCWHQQIENILGNPCEPLSIDRVPCGNSCPLCLNKLGNFIMPIYSTGVSPFLAQTFINNASGILTPAILI